jgi:hypothetical protein
MRDRQRVCSISEVPGRGHSLARRIRFNRLAHNDCPHLSSGALHLVESSTFNLSPLAATKEDRIPRDGQPDQQHSSHHYPDWTLNDRRRHCGSHLFRYYGEHQFSQCHHIHSSRNDS